jgi:hypothetical protein
VGHVDLLCFFEYVNRFYIEDAIFGQSGDVKEASVKLQTFTNDRKSGDLKDTVCQHRSSDTAAKSAKQNVYSIQITSSKDSTQNTLERCKFYNGY